MTRFARVLVIAMMAVLMSAAVASVSAADTGKRGSTVTIQTNRTVAPGHMRPALDASAQGEGYNYFGQYFDWSRFYTYLFWNFKFD